MKNRIKNFIILLMFVLTSLLISCQGSASPSNPDTPSDGKTYYTVTFDSDGGSTVASRKVESGTKVTRPDNPTKADYDFEGWFTGDTLYDFDTPVEANITLKAKWEIAIYTITFDSDGGSDVEEKYVTAGKTVAEPDAPGKQGYGFYGWYLGETEYDFSSAVHSDLTLKAKWGPVKAKEVTNENIVKTIKTLTESKALKASGEFSYELICNVGKALKELYEEKPSVLVSLDLSEVTGLDAISGFSGCHNLTSISIPDTVTSIGYTAFENCSKLTNFIIPDSVEEIYEAAFYNCLGFTSITIPASVKYIGKYAFLYCYRSSVTFINPTGWKYYDQEWKDINKDDLKDQNNAATLLSSTYAWYGWKNYLEDE